MNLARTRLRGFMSHVDSTIDFPPRGVVVVTGNNGAGKSSIVESVSVGGWGKTLRGSEPWSGDPCALDLTTVEGLETHREVKKGKKTLTWHAKDKQATAYETATKAQDALESVVGSWDVWRRASVFSSADASHFTLATDAERKRLLESILGLERFDVASDRARADAAISAATFTRLDRERAVAEERAVAASEAMDAAEQALTDHDEQRFDDPEKLAEEVAKLKADVTAAEAEGKKLQTMLDGVRSDLAAASAAASKAQGAASAALAKAATAKQSATQARAQLAKLATSETCPTCDGPLSKGKHANLSKAADEAERAALEAAKAATSAQEAAEAEKRESEAAVEELREERDVLSAKGGDVAEKLAKLRGSLSHAQANHDRAKSAKAARDRLLIAFNMSVEKHAGAKQAAKVAKDGAVEADKKKRTYEACARVLGTKGIRSHILGSALGGMEFIANAWLAKLGTGVAMTLSAYTERKSGDGMKDSIGLTLIGADASYGGGHGYKGSSGGERRRVDVALLFALAEVSAAAHGRAPGTLFIDEVFDSLDTDGVAAVSAALRELGTTRCIVVITHNPELVAALKPERHLVVDHGTVRRAA